MNGHTELGKQNGFSFLERIVNLIMNKRKIVGDPQWILKNNPKVINFVHPEQLKKILDLEIKKDKTSDDEILKLCENVIEYQPITYRKLISFIPQILFPLFFNQLYAGIDQYGLAGSWLTDALNTSVATYEIAPALTIIEMELIKFCCKKVGYDTDQSDGVFAPGGSMSNMFGMYCARSHMFPESKLNGIQHLKQLVLFASDNSHYSYSKGAALMGLGMNAVIKVPTDNCGKMIPEKLDELIENAIKNNQIPFMVGCTAGTTVLGAFDPLIKIKEICSKYKIWMHVDSCLGGTVLLSSKHRYLVDGISEANSISWNLHKMCGAPMQSSLFLVRDKPVLTQTMSINAEYLFQNDKFYDADYDLGDKTIQCGRKIDSFKNWIMLASKGEKELENTVDNLFEVRDYLVNLIKKRNTVSFWYLPPCLIAKKLNFDNISPDLLNKVCPILKGKMMEKGTIMINYQPITCKKLPNFFRMVLTCVPETKIEYMDFVIDEIERIGSEINIEQL